MWCSRALPVGSLLRAGHWRSSWPVGKLRQGEATSRAQSPTVAEPGIKPRMCDHGGCRGPGGTACDEGRVCCVGPLATCGG